MRRSRSGRVVLAGFDAEHVAGNGSVTRETISTAGIIPGLGPCAGGGSDENVLAEAVGQQIGVAVVGSVWLGPWLIVTVNGVVSTRKEPNAGSASTKLPLRSLTPPGLPTRPMV